MGCLAASSLTAHESGDRDIDAIKDNSFLVEEAYNQEAGVVQHVLTLGHHLNRMGNEAERDWELAFTQEWPLFSQTHQLSYTLPYSDLDHSPGPANGLGDALLHYRFQALFENEGQPALAPRFSLILPTGNSRRGLGEGKLGYQFNLPASKGISDRWAAHANIGFTTFPGLRGRDPVTPHIAGSLIYAPTRYLHCLLESFASWPEAIGDSGKTDRATEVVLSPGVRYAINWAGSQGVLGIGAPLGLTRSAPDYGFLLYLSFEHSFLRARPNQPDKDVE